MRVDEKAKEKAIVQADDIQRDEGGRWIDIFVERYETLKSIQPEQPRAIDEDIKHALRFCNPDAAGDTGLAGRLAIAMTTDNDQPVQELPQKLYEDWLSEEIYEQESVCTLAHKCYAAGKASVQDDRRLTIEKDESLHSAIFKSFKAKGFNNRDSTRYADIAEKGALLFIEATKREAGIDTTAKKIVDSNNE